MPEDRKRKTPHLMATKIGVETTVHFGDAWVEIKIRIPRGKLTKRLAGSDLRHLKRYGIIPK
jgi:hypothetical protein